MELLPTDRDREILEGGPYLGVITLSAIGETFLTKKTHENTSYELSSKESLGESLKSWASYIAHTAIELYEDDDVLMQTSMTLHIRAYLHKRFNHKEEGEYFFCLDLYLDPTPFYVFTELPSLIETLIILRSFSRPIHRLNPEVLPAKRRAP